MGQGIIALLIILFFVVIDGIRWMKSQTAEVESGTTSPAVGDICFNTRTTLPGGVTMRHTHKQYQYANGAYRKQLHRGG